MRKTSTIKLKDLRNIQLPYPRPSALDAFSQLLQVEKRLTSRIDELQQLLGDLFSEEMDEGAKLQDLTNRAHGLDMSIIQSDDLGFRIRNFYPFVLAYAYRLLDAIHSPSERYVEQLRVAENVLVFLGNVGLCMAAHLDKLATDDNRNLTKSDLGGFWSGGISPGDWQQMARQAGSLVRNTQASPAIDVFGDLWFRGRGTKESSFAALTKDLVTLKNDHKHDRGPKTEPDYQHGNDNLGHKLEECFSGVEFFVSSPMRLILDTNLDWATQATHLETLAFVGDHPGLQKEALDYPKPLVKGHLYLDVGASEWVPLYPLISVHYCPSCKSRETYFIDRYDGPSGRFVLKSFERGHTHENDEVTKQVTIDFEIWMNRNVKD